MIGLIKVLVVLIVNYYHLLISSDQPTLGALSPTSKLSDISCTIVTFVIVFERSRKSAYQFEHPLADLNFYKNIRSFNIATSYQSIEPLLAIAKRTFFLVI